MFLDDLVHDRQAEAGPFMFTALVLRREERIENVFQIGLLNPLNRVSFDTIDALEIGRCRRASP